MLELNVQWKPLNVITLGLRPEGNRKHYLNDKTSIATIYKTNLLRVIWVSLIIKLMITLSVTTYSIPASTEFKVWTLKKICIVNGKKYYVVRKFFLACLVVRGCKKVGNPWIRPILKPNREKYRCTNFFNYKKTIFV